MLKNTASQKMAFFAFDVTTGVAKTGDAANITGYVNKDWAGAVALTDTSAAEIDATNAPGWYLCDVAQAETNADALLFTGKSATADVSVVGQLVFTRAGDAYTVVSSGAHGNAALKTLIDTLDDVVDTEVGAIKAKTDLIPASPAAVADVPTAAAVATAVLAAATTTPIAANVEKINNVTLVGTGVLGDEFEP